jgi:hypothetical protein
MDDRQRTALLDLLTTEIRAAIGARLAAGDDPAELAEHLDARRRRLHGMTDDPGDDPTT